MNSPGAPSVDAEVARFEQLCKSAHEGGNVEATKSIVAFRTSASAQHVLTVAMRVVHEGRSAVACFEALSVIQFVCLKNADIIPSLLTPLLETTHARAPVQPRAVSRKMLDVCAMLYKRAFQPVVAADPRAIDCSPHPIREHLWTLITQWLSPPEMWPMKLLVLELMQNVLRYFVVSCPSMGLTFDYSYRCHCVFEELYLHRMYSICKDILEASLAPTGESSAARFACITRAVDLLTELLAWNWNATMELSTYLWLAIRRTSVERTNVSVPECWSFLVKQPVLFTLFIHVYKTMPNSDASLAALRGLTALASLCGGCLPRESVAHGTYMEWWMHACCDALVCIKSREPRAPEVLELCTMIERFIQNNPLLHMMRLVHVTQVVEWLQVVCEFTAFVCSKLVDYHRKRAQGGTLDDDDFDSSEEVSSVRLLIHGWASMAKTLVYRMLSTPVDGSVQTSWTSLVQCLKQVYLVYIQCRITAGVNSPELEAAEQQVEEEVIEEELRNEMSDAASIGRASLESSLPMLSNRMGGIVRSIEASNNASSWCRSAEELYWVLLLQSYLLADDTGEWESSCAIPSVICHYAVSSNSIVVHSIQQTFSLLEWEQHLLSKGKQHLVSPVVSGALLDFCARILAVYLFVPMQDALEIPIPPSILVFFHSTQLLQSFVALAVKNLSSQRPPQVLLGTCTLLKMLCTLPRISIHLMECPAYQTLLATFADWSLNNVPAPTHRKAVAALCMARVSENEEVKLEYFRTVMAKVSQRLMQALHDPTFVLSDSVDFCAALLEKVNGIADGCTRHNSAVCRDFFFMCMPAFAQIMETFKHDSSLYVPVVRLCARFVSVQAGFTSSWETQHINRIFDIAATIIKFCRGQPLQQPAKMTPHIERHHYKILRRLVMLLKALVRVVTCSGPHNTNRESQIDVVLFGLSGLLTHITESLLDYPKLRRTYYRVLKRVMGTYPDRMGLLPPDLFGRLMATLVFGLRHSDDKIPLLCIKGLKELFCAHVRHQVLAKQTAMNRTAVLSLMAALLQMLVGKGSFLQLMEGYTGLVLALLVCDFEAWGVACRQLASQALDSPSVMRLCAQMTDKVELVLDMKEEEKLRENIKAFVVEMRGVDWK